MPYDAGADVGADAASVGRHAGRRIIALRRDGDVDDKDDYKRWAAEMKTTRVTQIRISLMAPSGIGATIRLHLINVCEHVALHAYVHVHKYVNV